MNLIEKLTLKKTLVIFTITVILNLFINVLLFNYRYLPEIVAEYQKIANFIEQKVIEKNVDLKVSKDGINLNQESVLIEAKDFPIELNLENLIYISKNANYSDFKDKKTAAILNDKELILNINGEYQNLNLNDLLANNPEIQVSKETIADTIKRFFNDSPGVRNYLYTAFFAEKILFYIAQFIWGYVILAWIIFYTFKFSGYSLEKDLIKILTTLYFGLFVLIEPIIFYFKLPAGIFHVLFLGFIIITFYLKYKLDKSAKIEAES